MAERILAAILTALFACLLYIASSSLAHVAERGLVGEASLLVFCVIACTGWIAFLGAVVLAPSHRDAASLRGYAEWRPTSE